MTLDASSSLRDVVAVVGATLLRGGVRAVVTGGACAGLYSRGLYQSADVDLIVVSETTRKTLDGLMSRAGFRRVGDRYVHPGTRFYVEFPRGPLAIGSDDDIEPVRLVVKGRSILTLSPTDSCRDRLAAFFHWKDLQSLRVAVWIALEHRLAYRAIAEWSRREGFEGGYRQFLAEIRRTRGERFRRRARRRR